MPKRTTSFDLALPPRSEGTPAYRWLSDSLRSEILEGRLQPGTRLPGTRDVAQRYGMSRGTIVTAFEQLKEEGYLEGNIGAGTFVSSVLPEELLHARQARAVKGESAPKRRLTTFSKRVQSVYPVDPAAPRAFRPHLPALDLFPLSLWSQITARRIRGYSTSQMMGCDAMGHPSLREAIADYLRTARGMRCDARQILVVSGTQEAIDITARLFLEPGDRVAVEDPGYPRAPRVFEAMGAKILPQPIDEEGMVVRPSQLRGSRLVYVTPAHQFPTTVTMSLRRRLQLLEWARENDALILEDDYDSEYRYAGHPLPALQGLDRNGVVLFVASFNKMLFPSIRLGYMVVPEDLVEPARRLKALISRHMPLLEQIVLAEFIAEGHFGRHIRRMRTIYAERLSVLLEEGRKRFSGLLELSTAEAGLQTIGVLAPGMEDSEVAAAALARGIESMPLSYAWRSSPSSQGLMLGFAAIDQREIRRGARELAMVLEKAARESREKR